MDEPLILESAMTSSPWESSTSESSRAPFQLADQIFPDNHKISSNESVSSDLKDAMALQRDEVYERMMSWWRLEIRRKLVRYVKAESEVIARMQVKL